MANCANCSAPLPTGSITCDYCGSRNDVDLKGINYYTTNEPESERICPRCNIPLKTIDLKVEGTFLIERCDQCLGMFFDPGELEALLQATVKNVFVIDRTRLEALGSGRRAEDYPSFYINCPICGKMMNRINFGAKSSVIVDTCKDHGIWLDGGELRQLAEWMKAGGQLLDQERQEERKKQEAKAELQLKKERAQSAAAGECSEYGGFRNYNYDVEDDLFDLLRRAAIFFLR